MKHDYYEIAILLSSHDDVKDNTQLQAETMHIINVKAETVQCYTLHNHSHKLNLEQLYMIFTTCSYCILA